MVGGNLHVLTNASPADVRMSREILTAVHLDIVGGSTLASISALLTAGNPVVFGPTNGENVGGERAYAKSGTPSREQIGSAGLESLGNADSGGINLLDPCNMTSPQRDAS